MKFNHLSFVFLFFCFAGCSIFSLQNEDPARYGDAVPVYEIFPDIPAPKALPLPDADAFSGRPKVAIIIDDMGYDLEIAKKFIQISIPLNFSILPHTRYAHAIAELAAENNREVIVHLPMEPVEYPGINPGKGALLCEMSEQELTDTLIRNILEIPHIIGANNHMGSRMSQCTKTMCRVLCVLKTHNLFFVDSFTTFESKGETAARLVAVPFAKRDVFLDHKTDPVYIQRQLILLLKIAQKNGEAVGIGHPNPETMKVIESMTEEIKNRVEVVPISDLVHSMG